MTGVMSVGISSTSLVHVPIILSNYKNQYLYIVSYICTAAYKEVIQCLMLWEVKLCIQSNLSDYETKKYQ